MSVELSTTEVAMVRELLESRVGEFHSEIRRCRVYRYRDELKHKLKLLEQVLEKFSAPAIIGEA